MFVKIAASILAIILASISIVIDFKKKAGENKSILGYKIFVYLVILLSIFFSIKSSVSDEAQNTRLTNNIDTIKQSLQPYGLKIINNRAVPTDNYYTIINTAIKSKNVAGINYGRIGDDKTYYQTKIESNQTPVNEKPKNAEDVSNKNPEIIITHIPTIVKTKNGLKIIYSIQTKTSEEANKYNDWFTFLYVQNGKIYYLEANPQSIYNQHMGQAGTLSNYPKELAYEVNSNSPLISDTCYICLYITFRNSVHQTQKPFKIYYRKSKKTGDKLIPITNGKEYAEILYFMSEHTGSLD